MEVAAGQSRPLVQWGTADSPGSPLASLIEAPGTNTGFTETGRYAFLKPAGEWTLLIDDEPLGSTQNDPCCWLWQPGFFAGEVTAELCRRDGRRAALFLLDVAPSPAKLGRDDIDLMVAELLEEDPLLVLGTEPATGLVGHIGATEDPWLAFARLRRYLPDFLRSVDPVCRRPRYALQARRESAAIHRVRRVDRQTVMGVVRGAALALLAGVHDTEVDWQEVRFNVPSVEESVDSAANRAILAMIESLLVPARELLGRLSLEVQRAIESDTTTPLAPRWPRRREFLETAIAEFKQLKRRAPFSSVTRAEATASGLTAVAADPAYPASGLRVGVAFVAVLMPPIPRSAPGFHQRGRSTNAGVSSGWED